MTRRDEKCRGCGAKVESGAMLCQRCGDEYEVMQALRAIDELRRRGYAVEITNPDGKREVA